LFTVVFLSFGWGLQRNGCRRFYSKTGERGQAHGRRPNRATPSKSVLSSNPAVASRSSDRNREPGWKPWGKAWGKR
ncbi:MAG: hypothetical protein NNA19_06710, partial [Nitrospira sp.]|nr:hypothetical protein [Nitrospira sp.]